MDPRTKRELYLEELAVGIGAAKYYERVQEDEMGTKAGTALLRRCIPPMAQAVTEWLAKAESGAASRNAGVAHFAQQFDPMDLAFIVARTVLHRCAGNHRLTAAAVELANYLEDAQMSVELRSKDAKAWKVLRTRVERASFPGKRHVLIRKALGKAEVKRIAWGLNEKVRLGTTLIHLFVEATGVAQLDTRREGKQTKVYLSCPPDVAEWLDQAHQRCSLMMPTFLPMVVPPVPWTTTKGGGYINRNALKLKLVMARRPNAKYAEELKNHHMPHVYKALNAVQATPWRINRAVFETLKTLADSGSTVAGLPVRDDRPMPACPWGEGPAPNDKEKMDFKARLAMTHAANYRDRTKRIELRAKLWVAEEMVKDERIYFPHAMDWRGRIYPVPRWVNPQSDDNGRALLEFADAVPLGDDGAAHLAIHGANCYGVDKVPFEERMAWVEAHNDEIVAAGRAPTTSSFWHTADQPFMFLAFCVEWARLQAWVDAGKEQGEFASSLPVSWDGSCNGLQNFSAMLRDEVGGRAVNLIPGDKPNDVYQDVANEAEVIVARDADAGEVNANYWQGKITRKLAKRPTMTLPYGSGAYGFRDQIREELQKYHTDHGESYLKGDEFLCSVYLGNVMVQALSKTVVAAVSAMDWLKEVSQIAASEGLPVWWKTPAGFLVCQDYRTFVGKAVDFTYGGRRYQLTVEIETDKLDPRKQAQGISPNFVHSLDASHLIRTVNLCADAGIEHFAVVHDSYGTHAGNAHALNVLLREAFIQQYTPNVLEDFREQIIRQLPEAKRAEVPPIPPMGTLELDRVRDSEYFFA